MRNSTGLEEVVISEMPILRVLRGGNGCDGWFRRTLVKFASRYVYEKFMQHERMLRFEMTIFTNFLEILNSIFSLNIEILYTYFLQPPVGTVFDSRYIVAETDKQLICVAVRLFH